MRRRLLMVGRSALCIAIVGVARSQVRGARARARHPCARHGRASAPPIPASGSTGRSRSGSSRERPSTRSCRSVWLASCARSRRTPCSPRAGRRRRSCCSAVCWRAPGARVLLDVHGDWRAPTRLYGSPCARVLGPARVTPWRGSRCARPTRCGRSRRTRAGSSAPRASSRRPSFPAFMDLDPFLESAPGAAARAARGALRRRARALQGGGRARGRVAPSRAPRSPRRALRSSGQGHAERGRGAARGRVRRACLAGRRR